jgi:ribose/xylose/arabinose/galactoside ABC-type transport system permease subunit
MVADATGEKVAQFAQYMTTFVTGLIIGFVRVCTLVYTYVLRLIHTISMMTIHTVIDGFSE